MKRYFSIALGIVTSFGGFLDMGSLATSALAGAVFGFQLNWTILLGAVCLAFLVEMSGRIAIVGRETIAGAIRATFGWRFFVLVLAATAVVSELLLAAEIAGISVALHFATGISYQWFALPVAFGLWLLLWKGTFNVIEQAPALLGLLTLCFVVAAFKLHFDPGTFGRSLLPSLPRHDKVHYWFSAVSILGASISPYLFFFYSSGAVEDNWDRGHLLPNKLTAAIGMGFGSIIAMGTLVTTALVFGPRAIRADHFDQLPLILAPLGRTWFWMLVASIFVACAGAALEVVLAIAYTFAQGYGWKWSESLKPKEDARFALVYTVALFAAALPIALGADPMGLTAFSMALTAVALPIVIVPFLLIMNDKRYLGEQTNGWAGNTVVAVSVILAAVIAIVAIPLEIAGGG